MKIQMDVDGILLCPLCGFDHIHVDEVQISAREEDAEPDEITVHAITGVVSTHCLDPAPSAGSSRRHRISISGDCEGCGGKFALVFTQRKGMTYIEAVKVNNDVPW